MPSASCPLAERPCGKVREIPLRTSVSSLPPMGLSPRRAHRAKPDHQVVRHKGIKPTVYSLLSSGGGAKQDRAKQARTGQCQNKTAGNCRIEDSGHALRCRLCCWRRVARKSGQLPG